MAIFLSCLTVAILSMTSSLTKPLCTDNYDFKMSKNDQLCLSYTTITW